MDLMTLLTLIAVLSAIVSSATEWLKNLLSASTWDDSWSYEAHAALVQFFAFVVGAFVGYVAQLDVIHALLPSSTLPPLACYLLSGLALALPADALKTVLQWAKAARDAKENVGTSTSVDVHAQTTTTSTPEQPTPPTPYTAPGYTPTPASSNSHAGFASGASDKITPV